VGRTLLLERQKDPHPIHFPVFNRYTQRWLTDIAALSGLAKML